MMEPLVCFTFSVLAHLASFLLYLWLVIRQRIVRCAVQEDGAPIGQGTSATSGAIHVGGQTHAVTHGNEDILGQVYVEFGMRGPGGGVEGLHGERWLLSDRGQRRGVSRKRSALSCGA